MICRRPSNAVFALCIMFFATLGFAACGGNHSVLPTISGANGRTAVNNFASVASPFGTVSGSVVVTVPLGASSAESISVSVDGGAAVYANLTAGSTGCSGTSPVVCTIPVSMPIGSDVFKFKTFSGLGGSGSVIASGSLLQSITTNSSSVYIILAGTPNAISLALKTTSPHECNPAATIPLYVMVKDSSGNVIIGAYGEAVTLSDSDTSGKTKLSVLSVTTSDTVVTLSYDSHPLKTATISASATGVSSVTNAILSPQQMLYAAESGAVTVYPSSANGDATPVRTISGSNTLIGQALGVALDDSCDLDVTSINGTSISVFSADASGNVAPERVITGSNTLLTEIWGVAADASGNIYVGNYNQSPNPPVTSILEFAAGANGNVAPIKDISGTNTSMTNIQDVAIGPTGKIYAIANISTGFAILVFAAGANGNVVPEATITYSGLNSPFDLAVDAANKIYVTDTGRLSVAVFAANAHGSSTPIQLINGGNTGLFGPIGIAVSYTGKILVGNQNYEYCNCATSDAEAFLKGSNGNVAPKATIAGSNTGLFATYGIAL